jgi:hypothetical protein
MPVLHTTSERGNGIGSKGCATTKQGKIDRSRKSEKTQRRKRSMITPDSDDHKNMT